MKNIASIFHTTTYVLILLHTTLQVDIASIFHTTMCVLILLHITLQVERMT
jgi:hypothetical protein